jgi:hypothetical protein
MPRLQRLSLLAMQLAYATLERRVLLQVQLAQQVMAHLQVLQQVAQHQLELSELVELLRLVALLALDLQRVQLQVSHPLVAAQQAEMAAQEADVSTTQPSLPVLPRMV